MSGQPTAVGAYGLALTGIDVAASVLVAAEPEWPRFTVTNTIGQTERISDRLGEDQRRAHTSLGRDAVPRPRRVAGGVRHARADVPRRARASGSGAGGRCDRPLARTAELPRRRIRDSARTSGRCSPTAKAARARPSPGSPRAGTRSSATTCSSSTATMPFAGPRILDLRAESAATARARRLQRAGRPARALAGRARTAFRPGLRFRGWIFLRWSDELAVDPVRAGERLPRLAGHFGLRVPPSRPDRVLELAALPGWEFGRPPGLGPLRRGGGAAARRARRLSPEGRARA